MAETDLGWTVGELRGDQEKALHSALADMGESEFWVDDIEFEPARKMFRWYRSIYSSLGVELAKSHAGTCPASFLFLRRSQVNACAFRYGGFNFIGMNWGCVCVFQDVFMRMLACPNVLPEVGNSQAERMPEPLSRIPLDADELPSQDGAPYGGTVSPECPARAAYAHFLTQIALDYLYIHEYQHIAAGHLDLLAGKTKRTSISGDSEIGKILIGHVLELEADAMATNFSLKFACDLKGNAWRVDEEARPFLSTLNDRYTAWMFATLTLFILLEEADSLRKDSKPSSHPSAILMRSFFLMNIFSDYGPFRKSHRAMGFGMRMLDEAHRGLGQIVKRAPVRSFHFGLLAPNRFAHMKALAEKWQAMRPELERAAAAHGAKAAPVDIVRNFLWS